MVEITSNVFDIFHPTPVPLRELSAIVISIEIWRCEINKYRSSGSLKDFRPSGQSISSKTMIPDLPSVIYPIIDKYVERFGLSMSNWLWRHHRSVFHFHFNRANSVLEYFEDFICDYDGTIHYEKTAERMMNCDRFDVHQKFLIACTYCFEDDIVRIWPLGFNKTDSLYKRYSENLQFAYWVDFLENHIKITVPTIEEWVLNEFMPLSRSSLEYFWNLTSSENRLQIAVDLFIADLLSFVRFILPKLDDQRLDEFLYANGCELLYVLLKKSCYDEEVILSTWIYVKNVMYEITFTNLIVKMMLNEITRGCVRSEWHEDDYYDYDWPDSDCVDDRRDLDEFLQLCFEIWNTAAENLKRSAVRDITLNNRLFEDKFNIYNNINGFPPRSREFKFLLAVLSHATYEQRNVFLHNSWVKLIAKTCGEDLQNIIKLCLRDEDKITQFKTNVMANHEDIFWFCGTFLSLTYFDELNDFVRFLLPEVEAARNFKQTLLSHFIDDRRQNFSEGIVRKSVEFNEFINDAYNNIDRSTNFKNRLMSSPSILKELSAKALYIPLEQLIKFTDTFVSTERILREVKTHVINFLKEEAADYKSMVPKSSFTSLLSWCLEGNEEVSKFELSYL